MHTLLVDSKKRIRLPDAEPHQVYAYEPQGGGRILLTRLVKDQPPEAFPRGSLRKYLNREKSNEELVLLKAAAWRRRVKEVPTPGALTSRKESTLSSSSRIRIDAPGEHWSSFSTAPAKGERAAPYGAAQCATVWTGFRHCPILYTVSSARLFGRHSRISSNEGEIDSP
jgi:hypothetical protein